jgi:hypothetical protein
LRSAPPACRPAVRGNHPVLAGGDFVEHLAQAVDVRLRRARPFRRHESLGAHKGPLAAEGHQADVGQLGLAVDENDVGRLHVAVRQAALVQVVERLGQPQADIDALVGIPAFAAACWWSPRRVRGSYSIGIDVAAGGDVVAEFHHIVVERLAVRCCGRRAGC